MIFTQFPNLSRRAMLIAGSAGLLVACGRTAGDPVQTAASSAVPPLPEGTSEWRALTEDQWRSRLSPEAFRVLRRDDTERAFTSPLNGEKRPGTYHCAGCDLPLCDADQKYDSGTGWPSFWAPISSDVLGTKEDNFLWYPRTEYHCIRCGGHQGHVFNDGPAPTGLRYCNNGVALRFDQA